VSQTDDGIGSTETAQGQPKPKCDLCLCARHVWDKTRSIVGNIIEPFRAIGAMEYLTFFLVCITGFQFYALIITDHTFKLEQRAWIAPQRGELTSLIARGETIEMAIVYKNVGKNPALNVGHGQEIDFLDVPLDDQKVAFWNRMPIPENKKCEAAIAFTRKGGRTVFSQQEHSLYAYIWTTSGPPQEFFDRKRTFFVQGCFAYKTPDDNHIYTAPYCVFLYPAKGYDPVEWKFRFCPIYVDADDKQKNKDTGPSARSKRELIELNPPGILRPVTPSDNFPLTPDRLK
jgi:hypothetical protein